MGKISGSSSNTFKSAEYIYSKIKREFSSFGNANLLDDADFPAYTAEVLKQIGVGAYREEEAVLRVKDGKACLPKDFKYIYAAYKCCPSETNTNYTTKHLQNKQTVYEDTYYDILNKTSGCQIDCDSSDLISRVTVRQYLETGTCTYNYTNPTLLSLSPNVKEHCIDDCINLMCTNPYEITINNGYILTNFKDEDIYLKYYAFPFDANGNIEIPDSLEIEKAIEWYIKHQLLLNFWMVNDVTDIERRWGKAEQEAEKWMAAAQHHDKIPAFTTMVNQVRQKRGINHVSFFSQMDRNR